jgi:hypothetical protein
MRSGFSQDGEARLLYIDAKRNRRRWMQVEKHNTDERRKTINMFKQNDKLN